MTKSASTPRPARRGKQRTVAPNDAPKEVDDWLGRNLSRAANTVLNRFQEVFSEYDMRPALYSALVAIENNPGASGAQISSWMDVPRTNVVILLRELEERGLISRGRSDEDRRAQSIDLTQKGRRLMPKLRTAHKRLEAEFAASMSSSERQLLNRTLRRIWQAGPSSAE